MEICRSQPRNGKAAFKPVYPDYKSEEDIVTLEVVDKVQSTGEKDTDFIIVKEAVEVERKNRQEYLDAQAKGRSIYEIIDMVLKVNDPTLLHQGSEGVYGDFSKMPLDRGEEVALLDEQAKAVKVIPSELLDGKTLKEFLNSITEEQIAAYFKAKEEAANAEKKEGAE